MDHRMLLAGERIKECRLGASLSQRELAEKISGLAEDGTMIGSEKHISYLETGRRKLSEKYASLIGKALHIRPEYLLVIDDFKTNLDLEESKLWKQNYLLSVVRSAATELGLRLEVDQQKRIFRLLDRGQPALEGSIDKLAYLLNEIEDFSVFTLSRMIKEGR